MAYSLAQRLQSLSVDTSLALELEKQISTATPNQRRLEELGIIPNLAKYLTSGITANNLDKVKLTRYGMIPLVASEVVKANNAPANTALPTITGTAQVGQTLTRTTGTFTGTPTPSLSTQWTADNVAITGATGATYVPVTSDIGKVIRVVVTATNIYGIAPATSAPTAAVIAA